MKTGRFALLLSGLKLSLGKLFIGFLCLIIEKHYICHFFCGNHVQIIYIGQGVF